MPRQFAVAILLMLAFAGVGSSALLSRALAQTEALTAVQQEKAQGPRPTPHWYWRWSEWRLGEGYAKGHALQRNLRPKHAPQHIPQWAWRRLHYFRLARSTARKHGGHTTSTSFTTTASPTTAETTTTSTATTTTTTTATTTTATTTTATTTTPDPGWTNVVNDQFDSGGIPPEWHLYHGPYGSAPKNCAAPSHDYVANGYLNIVESYEPSTPANTSCPYSAGWYTGGLALSWSSPYSANDQRVTIRYRIVSTAGIVSHHIIPMRFPSVSQTYFNNGEEDFLESDYLSSAYTFLHYGSSSTSNGQIYHKYSTDLTQWHTVRFTQSNHSIYAYVDDMTTPVWVYDGDSTTIPDVARHVVLQQECSHSQGCPTGTAGSEDIQIDWITVDNAS
jgi:hypothetical protein